MMDGAVVMIDETTSWPGVFRVENVRRVKKHLGAPKWARAIHCYVPSVLRRMAARELQDRHLKGYLGDGHGREDVAT